MSEQPTVHVDILTESALWGDGESWLQRVDRAVRAAIEACDAAITTDAELSVVLTDDAAIRLLNRDHRGKDSATNVLSFPQDDPDSDAYGPLLGDIVVAHETVAREATEGDLPFDNHFAHMIVHGFLHLVGYDHITDEEAEEMEGLETAVLADLGIPDPYAGDR